MTVKALAITLRTIAQELKLKSLSQQTLTLSAALSVKSFSLRPLSPITPTANPLRPTTSLATPSLATPTLSLLLRSQSQATVMVQALKHPPRDIITQALSQLSRMSPMVTLLKRPPSLLFTRKPAAFLQGCTVRGQHTTRSLERCTARSQRTTPSLPFSPPTLAHLRPESRMSIMTSTPGRVALLAATRDRTPKSQPQEQPT